MISLLNPRQFLNIHIKAMLIFFIVAIGVMYFGYFKLACDSYVLWYSIILFLWIFVYLVLYGFFLEPIYSIYGWFFYLLFFPKKPISVLYSNSIFGTLFSIDSEILIFSFYEVIEVGLLATILIHLVRQKLLYKIDMLSGSLLLIIGSGILHILTGYKTMNHILVYQSIIPLLAAFIIYKSVLLIKTKLNLDFIFNMFMIFVCILLLEYTVGRLGLLPESITYYIFNYRNAYRSILVSSDLLLSLLLIVSAFISLYKYTITNNIVYVLLFIGANYLLIETFNRTPFFALVIVVFGLAIYLKKFVQFFIYIGIIYFMLMPISKHLSSTQLPMYHIYAINHNISVDEAYIILYGKKPLGNIYFAYNANEKNNKMLDGSPINHNFDRVGGYFSHSSLLDRLGASLRGIDVLIYTNYFGIGPGQLVESMIDNNIPSYFNDSILLHNEKIRDFYNQVRNGEHVTNTHMLYTNLLAEYGIVVIVAYIAFIYKIFSFLRNYRTQKKDILSSISFAIVLAYCIYYSCQVVPILLSVLLFFFNIVNQRIRGRLQ